MSEAEPVLKARHFVVGILTESEYRNYVKAGLVAAGFDGGAADRYSRQQLVAIAHQVIAGS